MSKGKNKWSKEDKYLGLLTLVLLAGIASQIKYENWFPCDLRNSLKDVSEIILPIQAALFGMTISLVALITNRSSEVRYGIRYTDYYMNLKPVVFKQKTIIGLFFVLLVSSIGCYFLQWYILILAFFLLTCILIWISVDSVYLAVAGNIMQEKELANYVERACENSSSSEMEELITCFCIDLRNKVGVLNHSEKHEYLGVYSCLVVRALKKDNLREILENQVSKTIKICFVNQRDVDLGLQLLNETYLLANRFVLEHPYTANHAKGPFRLFDSVYHELCDSCKSIGVFEMEDYDMLKLAQLVMEVNQAIALSESNANEQTRWNAVIDFGAFLGGLVAKHHGHSMFHWGEGLYSHWEQEGWQQWSFTLSYIAALIRGNDTKLLKMFWFSRRYYDYDGENTNKSILLYIAVHCYMFCMLRSLEKRHTDLPKLDIDLINDPQIKKFYSEFFDYAVFNDENLDTSGECKWNLFNQSLSDFLQRHISGLILAEIEVNRWNLVETDAVSDYVVLLALAFSIIFDAPEILPKMVEQKKGYEIYIRCMQNESQVKQLLNQFFDFICTGSARKISSDEAFEALLTFAKESYKFVYLHEPLQKTVDSYLPSQHDRIEMLERTSENYLREKLDGVLDAKFQTNHSFQFFQMTLYTDHDPYAELKGNYQYLFNSLVILLAEYLEEHKCVSVINREAFSDDEEWLAFLKSKDHHIMIGSSFALWPSDWHKREYAEKILKGVEQYTVSAGKTILIFPTGALKLNLGSVHVQCVPETIKHSGAVFNPKSGMYQYSFTSGFSVELTEEELQQYLEKNRRVYLFSVDVGISMKAGTMCEAVVR